MKVDPSLSRRGAIASAAALLASGSVSVSGAELCTVGVGDAGPSYSASGPHSDRYGAAEGYPIADPNLVIQPGDPNDPKYRVGAYSHFDEVFPTRRIPGATVPWCFGWRQTALPDAVQRLVATHLSANAVTGLLIVKSDEILFELYQYGRTDRDRLYSGSMAKTITAMLVGVAVADGAIRSVDDAAGTYVPRLRGSEYGRTPIRDLLHMTSGVDFGEDRDGGRDLDRLWIDAVLGRALTRGGTVASVVQFDTRIAPPGTRFSYASIEPDVLGLVLRSATGIPMSDYLHDRIWTPIGAEADATWLIDAEGGEVAHGFFNATLRDYARFGRLLAHDGAWNGRQLIPSGWLVDATTVRASDPILAPGRSGPGSFGYGYFTWLLSGSGRQFALIGLHGQTMVVDPGSKLVLVQTAVETNTAVWRLWAALTRTVGRSG